MQNNTKALSENEISILKIESELIHLAKQAKEAAWILAKLSSQTKNTFLIDLAEQLISHEAIILQANQLDIIAAKEANLSSAMLDRLLLTQDRILQIAQEVRHVASLPDPVGKTLDGSLLDSGLRIERRVVPLGVVATIYEARPNVTIDVASLCFKTGNAAILRGGKETHYTNQALLKIIQSTLVKHSLPGHAIQAILNPQREYVNVLLRLDRYIDMLIPRGGAGLHRLCKEQSTIPVITGGIGVCHLYLDSQYFPATPDETILDATALKHALTIIDNAKIQRPSACNSLETLLVQHSIAKSFIPQLYRYMHAKNVILRVCNQTAHYLSEQSTSLPVGVQAVTEENYGEESLGLLLNVAIVEDIDEAITHIRCYGTAHSDGILTQNMAQADYFIESVDSAAVYVNASTRFTDGAQFGLGAEVAVSTQKLHARGPMGLEALTTYKWIGRGNNTIRS